MSTRMVDPVVVSFAPTGMVPQRTDNPNVPITPAEIGLDVERASKIGISYVHLHSRTDSGEPEWRAERFRESIGEIRSRCPDMVICVTTSGRNIADVERRADSLSIDGDLKPELASLTLASMNFAESASVNAPETVRRLAALMHERGIKPELEIFDLGMANYACYLAEKGLITPPFLCNLILGGPASAQAGLLDLGLIVDRLPQGSRWAAGGIGRAQFPAIGLSIHSGGGARVGLEDNLWLDADRTVLATNSDLVERVHRIAEAAGRPVMGTNQFRASVLSHVPSAVDIDGRPGDV